MFDWIISPVNLKPNGHHDGYRIRSSDNPFSYSFGETALVEQRQGFPDDWYYGFNVTVNMLVSPTEPLNTTDGVAIGAVCEYQAVLSAKLYTARNATVPEGSDLSQDQNPRPWPFASDVELTAASGPAVPNCKGARNGVRLADDFSIASGYECTCTYTNDRERLDVL